MSQTRANSNQRRRERSAFTLIEILIVVVILGILAAITIPQFSNATHEAREAMLKDDLRFLRTQITVFAAQHRDVPPGYSGGNPAVTATSADFIAQMTEYTDEYCNISATPSPNLPLGIYCETMPTNPINGLSTIMVLQVGQSLPTQADNNYGWIYQPSTQTVLDDATGADIGGTSYFTY